MFDKPSIETLRSWVKRDQEAFDVQNKRLDEIQNARAEDLTAADRNTLQYWDREVLKTCNRHLEEMENIKETSVEERGIMQELNKLINLGDHIMERKNLVHMELTEKLRSIEVSFAGTLEELAICPKPGSATTIAAPLPADGNVEPILPTSTSQPSSKVDFTSHGEDATTIEPSASQQPHGDPLSVVKVRSDPSGAGALYKLLGVRSDAPSGDVKRAIKRQQIGSHPDKHLNASEEEKVKMHEKYVSLQAADGIFATEDMRREFDDTGKISEISDLQARLAGLKM